ncbi:MAG: HEAT repeat domain-containing protein [Deltaproteobacteria bacterium]|nr:HEAT repeat domain-containing protein [Deltaproteobacteria bacterium]
MYRSILVALTLVAATRALPAVAAAPRGIEARAPGSSSDDVDARRSLRERFGVAQARQLLVAGSIAERLRGIERLGQRGDREALEALLDAVDGGGPSAQHPRTRLAVARALAPHAATELGRRGLEAIFAHGVDEDVPRALGELARETAALALARAAAGIVVEPSPVAPRLRARADSLSAAERALTPLLVAVIASSPLAPAAARALGSHRPAELGAFVRGLATLSVPEIRLLGRLGDPRAIPMLRRALTRDDAEVQDEAALALARLGDHTSRERFGAQADDAKAKPARARLVAEAELVLGVPEGAARLARLLADDAQRAAALALAEAFPSPRLVAALVAAFDQKPSAPEAPRLVALLARIGGDVTFAALERRLDDPILGPLALDAMARLEAPVADERAVAMALEAPLSTRRAWLRLAAARLHARATPAGGELVGRATQAFERAASSRDPTERSLGWFGLVLFGARSIAEGVTHREPDVRAATVSAAAALPHASRLALLPLARRALGVRAAGAAEPIEAAALALVLEADPSFGSAGELAAWAESGGVASVQAAHRLASRDPRDLAPRIAALLAGTDPLVRAHVALGLGESHDPSALARLEEAYASETDAFVRFALVRALGSRREFGRGRALRLAAELDPDVEVRQLAAAALAGPIAEPERPRLRSTSVLALAPSQAMEPRTTAALAALCIDHGRPARVALSAPDGLVIAFGFDPEGPIVRPLPRSR